jgi:hypothetical protein
MKTEITRAALLGMIAGMVVVPSLTRGLTSDACGKERKAFPPIESTGDCSESLFGNRKCGHFNFNVVLLREVG